MDKMPKLPPFPPLGLLDQLRESVVVTDAEIDPPGPRILYVNPAFTLLTGYRPDEVLNRAPRLLQGPETDRRVLDRLRKCLETGEPFEGEAINYRKDGSSFVMRWYIEALRNEEGRVTHFFALQRDATEELEENRQRRALEQAIAQLVELVALFGLDGRVSYANDAYLKWAARQEEEVVGTPVWRLFGAPQQWHDLQLARRKLGQGNGWQHEYSIKKSQNPHDQRFVFVTVSPIRGPGGKVTEFVAVGRDVTEHRRLTVIAEAHNFHNNLGVVFSGIRHELGNPINSIKTALQVVNDGFDRISPTKLQKYLTGMQDEIGRVEYLLRSLRSYSLYDKPRPEAIDVNIFLSRFLKLAQRDANRLGATVKVQVERGAESIWADPQGLHQVLLNLLGNSLKALEGEQKGEVRIHARGEGHHVLLLFSDNGHGIPPEHLPNVTKPFFTTRSGGTGLGLSISQHLLAMMEGTMEIHSAHSGTAVQIQLKRESPSNPRQRHLEGRRR